MNCTYTGNEEAEVAVQKDSRAVELQIRRATVVLPAHSPRRLVGMIYAVVGGHHTPADHAGRSGSGERQNCCCRWWRRYRRLCEVFAPQSEHHYESDDTRDPGNRFVPAKGYSSAIVGVVLKPTYQWITRYPKNVT